MQTLHYSALIDMLEGLVYSTPILLSARILITLLRKRLTVITNMKRQQKDREFSKVPGLSATLDSYELFKKCVKVTMNNGCDDQSRKRFISKTINLSIGATPTYDNVTCITWTKPLTKRTPNKWRLLWLCNLVVRGLSSGTDPHLVFLLKPKTTSTGYQSNAVINMPT